MEKKVSSKERNKKIRDRYLSSDIGMRKVGEEFGLSKERIRQILLSDFNIKGQEQIELRNEEKVDKIKSIIADNPEISITEIAEFMGIDRNQIQKLIKEYNIECSGNTKSTEKWTLAMRSMEIGDEFESTYDCKFPRQNFYSKAKNAGIKISTIIVDDRTAVIKRIE